MQSKFIIYQMLPRLFGNTNPNCVYDGTFEENGSGKFSDVSEAVLEDLKKLSVTLWKKKSKVLSSEN